MPIEDKPNLILTLTMHADEEEELEWMLKEVARQVKTGECAGQGGGCSCSYYYGVEKLTADAELPLEPSKSIHEPVCKHTAIEEFNGWIWCLDCNAKLARS